MGYTVVIPALSRMDHCRPAIEFVRNSVPEKNPKIHVIFVPLKRSIQRNLAIFVDEMVNGKYLMGNNETCHLIENAIEDTEKMWHESWRDWITSVEYLSKGSHLSQIFVVLTSDLPNGVVLSSAMAALSVPNLKLVELPVGYDLTIRENDFNPSATLKEQVVQYPTWGDVSIQKPILEIASKPEAGLTLAVIRNIAEKFRDRSILVERHVPRSEIRQCLLQYNRQVLNKQKTIKDSALSQRLKTLRKLGLIEKIPQSRKFVLTPEGVNISGLLRNVWELHMVIDDRTLRGGHSMDIGGGFE